MRPELVMKSIVPVVMAGVLGIYGLIIAVIISTNSEPRAAGAGRMVCSQSPRLFRSVCLTHLLLPARCLPACLCAVNQTADKAYYFFDGYAHFAAGLACGLAGLGAGMAIGIVGDAGVRANAQQPKLFVGMILILIFAEALALYGLIGARGGEGAGGRLQQQQQQYPVRGQQPRAPPPLLTCPCRPRLCCPAVGIILASKAGTATPM